MSEKKKPPTCPSCGEDLGTVEYESCELWMFNPETGKYELTKDQSATTECPHCGADLDGDFPEGPANYTDEESSKT